MPLPSSDSRVRRAELMAALSVATDLAMGQPAEYAMATSIVAVRLGELARLSGDDLRDAYFEALLRYIGCNADTYWLSSIIGDEIALRTEFARIDAADTPRVLSLMLRSIREANAGAGLARMTRAIVEGMANLQQVNTSFFAGHCDVARRLAERLGFPESFVRTVGQIYARWDGKGVPALKGDAISPALLVASLAHDVVTFHRIGGVEAAIAMARERSGGAHSPKLVELFRANAARVLEGLGDDLSWEMVMSLEPGEQRTLSEAELDDACEAIADFADIKSPWFLGHSRRVAELAVEAARGCGLPAEDVVMIRRAALLHDIGKVGVSAGVWGKDGSLNEREWEQVRMHPYHTERVLARPAALARIGALASQHHERLDGSGYYRSLGAAMLSPAARILAAANRYASLAESRPHRAALAPGAITEELRREARERRLDADAVNAVLAAAGHRVPSTRGKATAGLSEREIEVLRLVARGRTIKQMASELFIAPKTVDRHLQNIYGKIGVSTRAGATLFAMENNLLA